MSVPSAVRIAIGARVIAVAAAHPDDAAAVAAILRGFPGAAPRDAVDVACDLSRAVGGLWELRVGGALTHEAATLEHALLALEWQVVQECLARTPDAFHLHGAALADPSGRTTVLLLGESGAGKTTLTLALMARGFRPFGDDVVLLDEALRPQHFPRAFHIDERTRQLVTPLFAERPGATGGRQPWEHAGLPPGFCLPLHWAGPPVPVGMIVLPQAHGAPAPRLERQTVTDAAIRLLSYSTTLEHDPARALKAVSRLTAAAPCFALQGGPLPATVDLVAATVTRVAPGA